MQPKRLKNEINRLDLMIETEIFLLRGGKIKKLKPHHSLNDNYVHDDYFATDADAFLLGNNEGYSVSNIQL